MIKCCVRFNSLSVISNTFSAIGEIITKILHFTTSLVGGIRLQRYLQSNVNNKIMPVVFASDKHINSSDQAQEWAKTHIQRFRYDRSFRHMLPTAKVNLKRVFKALKCDIVHAHQVETAYYSYKKGLPTIFDDWEYHLEFSKLRYCKSYYSIEGSFFSKCLKNPLTRRLYKKRCSAVLELLANVPVIVTNDAVKKVYEDMGTENVWTVPNVPVKQEVEYAFRDGDVEKSSVIITCYIGNLSRNEESILRCTKGIKELWKNFNLGKLHAFEDNNRVPHLEIMRQIRRFHFNLLFWRPLRAHKYYLQNKAFLASAMGLPTIISSSLISTIALLKDYALVVDSIEEIPDTIKNYNPPKIHRIYEDHYWEYYEKRIKSAYNTALSQQL